MEDLIKKNVGDLEITTLLGLTRVHISCIYIDMTIPLVCETSLLFHVHYTLFK